MSILQLSVRNTHRQPRRTLLTGLAICIAVAAVTFMDAYFKGAIEGFFSSYVKLEAGHVKVMPKKAIDRTRPLPLSDGISGIAKLTSLLESVDGVVEVSPRIRFPVLLDKPGGSLPALCTATQPSRESGLLDIESLIVEGRVPVDDGWEAALGVELADEVGLDVGDELFMVTTDSYGGLGPGLFQVVGLTRTGVKSIDRRNFYVSLTGAQDQLIMEDAAMEVVCRIEGGMESSLELAAVINDKLSQNEWTEIAAVPWQKQGALYSMLAPARMANFLIMGLLGIVALTTVINTVLMSVLERTREIGALRAMGFKRGEVVRMILGESLVIGVVGTLCGIAVGMIVGLILQRTGIDFSSAMGATDLPIRPIIYPDPSIIAAIKAGLFGLLVSLVAAWYPARVAVRLLPAQALRRS